MVPENSQLESGGAGGVKPTKGLFTSSKRIIKKVAADATTTLTPTGQGGKILVEIMKIYRGPPAQCTYLPQPEIQATEVLEQKRRVWLHSLHLLRVIPRDGNEKETELGYSLYNFINKPTYVV